MRDAEEQGPEAVLITGLFGTGKSSVTAEIADVLEKRGAPYAAMDLDWLAWFDTHREDGPGEHRMMLTNLAPVVVNYLRVGVRFFVLARSLQDGSELDSLRAELPMPLRAVRLTVPLDEIERRLSSDVTAGRRDDLREAAEWLAASKGQGFEDLTVSNERPIREVTLEIVEWLGWV